MNVLVSVRSADEARLALAAGVGWIDIKEPRAGALGAASHDRIRDIVAVVAGRRPVSATIGDTWASPEQIPPRVRRLADSGLDYVKVGVAGTASLDATVRALDEASLSAAIIAVCAAEQAQVAELIARRAAPLLAGIMLDTADKTGAGLCRLHNAEMLAMFVAHAHAQGLLAGLAGKLREQDIAPLRDSGADYLGFRSAVCVDGKRGDALSATALARVVHAVQGSPAGAGTIDDSIGEVA